MKTTKKISKAILKEAEGINIIQNNKAVAGQFVPHIHFHIIPRYKGDDIRIESWSPKKYAEGEMEKVGARIKQNL